MTAAYWEASISAASGHLFEVPTFASMALIDNDVETVTADYSRPTAERFTPMREVLTNPSGSWGGCRFLAILPAI